MNVAALDNKYINSLYESYDNLNNDTERPSMLEYCTNPNADLAPNGYDIEDIKALSHKIDFDC